MTAGSGAGSRVSAIVVVSFESPPTVVTAIERLLEQSHPPSQVLVVDNHPDRPVSAAVEARGFGDGVRTVAAPENLGYPRAVNLGAAEATGDWLFMVNPDARVEPECLARLVEATQPDGTAIVGAQVLLPDGRVNAGDNPMTLAGVSWSGGYGGTREQGPPRDTAGVSGAALMARRDVFSDLGGLCPHFFLYQDDADLCWRAWLAGWRVRYCPEAAVTHDFEFQRGPQKWFHLERNRGWVVLSNYSLVTLILVAPVLLAAELAVTARAVREGWLGAKARAVASLATSVRDIRRWRASVQATRRVPDSELIERFRGGVETELIDSAMLPLVNPLLEAYRRMVLRLLRLCGR